jgi:glycosyltransferase involved in cell wall biosynthesis
VDPTKISVIVRARDEAAKLPRCLEYLRAQELGGAVLELILVDSGSSDDTVAIARRHGARVLEMPSASFTFGGALNLGAGEASGELLVALSADAFATDRDWLARLLEPFSDPRVACASGDWYGPEGDPLPARVLQDAALARRIPEWGYSNGAGAFRASLWRERPFRSDLSGCEDRDWALHWLEQGYLAVIDPALVIDHDHTHDSLASIYRRAHREAHGYATFLHQPPQRPSELARAWWSDLRFYDSPLRARLSHRRAARLLGAYTGRRRASRG